jgi:hypothetical protein
MWRTYSNPDPHSVAFYDTQGDVDDLTPILTDKNYFLHLKENLSLFKSGIFPKVHIFKYALKLEIAIRIL